MNWEAVQSLIDRQGALFTQRGRLFFVIGLTETSVIVHPHAGWQYMIPRVDLERAVELVQQGETFARPTDYRHKVSGTQSSYAWGILRTLGYV